MPVVIKMDMKGVPTPKGLTVGIRDTQPGDFKLAELMDLIAEVEAEEWLDEHPEAEDAEAFYGIPSIDLSPYWLDE